jgi:hypothetical protein
MSQFWHTLTTEEQDALNAGLLAANRDNFHRSVMQELLDPKIDRIGKQMELFPEVDELERGLQRQRGR